MFNSPTIDIESDNLFRLIPDDTNQGQVLSKIIEKNEIKKLIIIWRNDIWGNDLKEQIENNFDCENCEIIFDKNYHKDSPESLSILKLDASVKKAIETYGEDKVGIVFLSFNEIAHFMKMAEKNNAENLAGIKWFGPGAITKEERITNNLHSLNFLQKIDLTSIQVSPSTISSSVDKQEQINNKIFPNEEPSSFVYSTYDAIWLIGLTLQKTPNETTEARIDTLINIANNYTGSIGPTKFDEKGSLVYSNYTQFTYNDGKWVDEGVYFKDKDASWKFDQS